MRTVPFVAFAFCLSIAAATAESPEWLRGSHDDLEIRLSGEVFRTSGTSTGDMHVTISLEQNGHAVGVPVKLENDRYEAWLPVNRHDWYTVRIDAVAQSGDEAFHVWMPQNELRQAAIDGYDLVLSEPMRQVTVRIVDDGIPVPDAQVAARVGTRTVTVKSDAKGSAVIQIYGDESVYSVAAWTRDRVGGFQPFRKPKRDPKADSYVCELHPVRQQTFRILDEAGEPVADLPIEIKVATPLPDYNYFGNMPFDDVTTNDDGLAVHTRFPDWDEVHCYVDMLDPAWAKVGDLIWADGMATQVVKLIPKRRRVRGVIVGEEVAGHAIEVSSFQHPQENRIDRMRTFCDAEGNFSFDAFPDATYVAFVDDPTWVSPIVDYVPLPNGEPGDPIELEVKQGINAKAVVTAGDTAEPMTGVRVRFQNDHRFKFNENGEDRSGRLGRDATATTNEQGVAEALVLPGTLKVSASGNGWRINKEVQVAANEPVLVELSRPFSEPQQVMGQLVLADDADSDLSSVKIFTGAIDGRSDETMETSAETDGTFQFETQATHFGVYAETSDGGYAGSATSREVDQTVRVRMLPTISYHGRLLNKAGKPIADHKIQTQIDVKGERDYDAAYLTEFDVRSIDVTTDNDGYYTFKKLPAQMPLRIWTYAPHDPEDWEPLAEIFLQPGENRPVAVDRISDGSPDDVEATPNPTLEERFAKVLRDCRLGGYRLMVIRTGDSQPAQEFADQYLLSYRHLKAVARYMPVKISGEQELSEADARFAETNDWPNVADNEVFVSVYDTSGEEIDQIMLDVADENAVETSDAFVSKHAQPVADAKKKWRDAFELAKQTDRRVWAINGGRYCGPCIQFSRWIDDHAKLLSRDYVFIKVDNVMDDNGREVAKRITRGGSFGIPFHAIFDIDGNVLSDSEGPTGNIGMPSGFEGVNHLQVMIDKSRQTLTAQDLANLIASLRSSD